MKRVALPRRQGLKLRGDMPTAPLPAPDSLRGVGGRRNNPLLRNRAMPETIQARSVGPIGAGAHRLVVIGTSTGGPQALQNVITQLPGRLSCGVVVVQHMPPGFTKALADRLDSISQVAVKEAEDGDVIRAGCVYIAPGDFDLRIKEDGDARHDDRNQIPTHSRG